MTQKELREQNRAAVIRAAQGRFLAQSIDKTTIAEIAEDADLTPMSVYRYFGSKQAIAVAVANHLLDAYLAEHSARCEAPGAARRRTVMRRFPAYWVHISIPTRPIRNTSAFCRTWRSMPCASS